MFCFFKQKTADEVRISDWSSDVCSSDLELRDLRERAEPDHLGGLELDVLSGEHFHKRYGVGEQHVAAVLGRDVVQIARGLAAARPGHVVHDDVGLDRKSVV